MGTAIDTDVRDVLERFTQPREAATDANIPLARLLARCLCPAPFVFPPQSELALSGQISTR